MIAQICFLLFIFCGTTQCLQDQQGELLQVVVLTRHGDRTPTEVFPNTKSQWPEGWGQLTNIGMKAQFELGKRFRQKYVKEHQLLDQYHKDTVRVWATSSERTLMSAQCFMLGLFPEGSGPQNGLPRGFQPIPTFIDDKLMHAYQSCHVMKDLTHHYRQQEDYTKKTEEHSDLFQELTPILGHPIQLKDMTKLHSLLNAERVHQRSTLEGISPQMKSTIKHLSEWNLQKKFFNRQMGRLGAGLLVKKVVFCRTCRKSNGFF